jgi:hypothetical protein
MSYGARYEIGTVTDDQDDIIEDDETNNARPETLKLLAPGINVAVG